MSRYGLDDMYICDVVDEQYEFTGKLALKVSFTDAPHRVHTGVMHAEGNREAVVAMLRELATHIEYDVNGDIH